MGAAFDWMPSGAKLVTAYDRKHENKPPLIVFFGKNGLERDSFSIDEPAEVTVKTLKCNCNSDILAASVTCNSYGAIKIWSFCNYHWYLKQEIRYVKQDEVEFTWHPTKPLHLICWTHGGKVRSYNFVWTTVVTETSTALVIDNSNVLITPFCLSLMLPPMSLFMLKFCSAVQDISFLCKNSRNHLTACLANGNLCIVELPGTDTGEQFEDKEFDVETSFSDLTIGTLVHLTWLDSHSLLGVSRHLTNRCTTTSLRAGEFSHQQSKCSHGYFLLEIELVCSEDSVPASMSSFGWHANVSNSLSLEGPVVSVVSIVSNSFCSNGWRICSWVFFKYRFCRGVFRATFP